MINRVEQLETMCSTLQTQNPGLLVKQLDGQSTAARHLLGRLLHAPEAQRPALAASRKFRNLRLADLLLEESRDLQVEQPRLSEELASLAFQIAEQPHEPKNAARVDEARATACVLIGAARRIAGDLRGAEKALGRAATYLSGPPDTLERGYYTQQLAALRRDQERDDEAAGLLWRAALIYNEGGDVLEEAACLAGLGQLFVIEGQVARAILPLTRAGEALDLHPDPSISVLARLALAVCHACLGEADKAQRLVKTARARYGRLPDSGRQLAHVAWLEGKVAAYTGNLEDARGLLDTAFRAFVRQERLYDAVFSGLDLAAVLARQGRLESLGFLIYDIGEGFRADVAQIGILRVLGTVESALQRGRRAGLESLLTSAAVTLRHYRRDPLLAVEGLNR